LLLRVDRLFLLFWAAHTRAFRFQFRLLPRSRLFTIVVDVNRVDYTSQPRSFPVLLPHLDVPRIRAI
jgi:hypothetical protein